MNDGKTVASCDSALREHREQMRVFLPNRRAFPLEELLKYENQWIAWSRDGTRIIAHTAESELAIDDLVRAAGEDPSACLVEYIPDADRTTLGGVQGLGS